MLYITSMNQKLLHERFEYKDGNLIYKIKASLKTNIGDIVGSPGGKGYTTTRINYKQYSLHRLIWIYHNGDIPNGLQIDHDNKIRNDNRIENLRIATNLNNCYNKSKQSRNKSGYKGVCWCKQKKKWSAEIRHNKIKKHLGYFTTAEEAHEAYKKAAIELHGEFACWE